MTSSLFPTIPETKPPVAESIAAGLLREVDAEAQRRAGQHVDWWRAFWESPEATPVEIAAAMGPSAGIFFGVASINVSHIQSVATMIGKPITDFMPEACLTTPVTVTVNPDGTVAIG